MADLAKAGDPYVDHFGSRVITLEKETMGHEEYTARRVTPVFDKFKPASPIAKEDAPDSDAKQMAVVAAIVGMRLVGLEFHDIADIMGATHEEMQRLIALPSTQITFDRIFRSTINLNADTVQGRIAARAGDAADTVFELMTDREMRGDVRLKAAQDVLDRSGTHADHFFAKDSNKATSEDELRITVMTEDGQSERVSVELKRK